MRVIYVLDPTTFMRVAAIDDYESLVWTERFCDIGDFTLTIPFNEVNFSMLTKGVMLSLGECNYTSPASGYADMLGVEEVMIINKVALEDDSTGGAVMTVTGKSLLSLFEGRVTGPALSPSGSSYDNAGSSTAYSVIDALVEDACGSASPLSAYDTIPNLTTNWYRLTGFYVVDLTIERGTLWDRIKEIADAYDLGLSLRLQRVIDSNGEDGISTFNVCFVQYKGRVVYQPDSYKAAVVFSVDIGNLQGVSEVSSMEDYYNAAYVYGKDKAVAVEDSDGPYEAWERRVIIVDASDISGTGASATDKLTNRGLAALKKSKITNAVDGVVPEGSGYVYGMDYYMGDYVKVITRTGTEAVMQVTEFIRVYDKSGDHSYPTLTMTDKTIGSTLGGVLPIPGSGGGTITLPVEGPVAE